jgi:DNA-binding IclR family transcriptional regulator
MTSSVKEIQSVRNACRVVETIARVQPIGVSELARATGIDKSGVHRLAITLYAAGWLDHADDGRWSISPALSTLVRVATLGSLVEGVRPLLERARDQTGETAMLVVPDGHRLRIVAIAESHHNLQVTARVGAEMPARHSAALRVLAAHFGPPELQTWRAIDPDLTEPALAVIRERGWSVNDGELSPHTRAVAAALLRPDGASLAAFVLCGPSARFSRHHIGGYGRLVASLTTQWQGGAKPDSSAGPTTSGTDREVSARFRPDAADFR